MTGARETGRHAWSRGSTTSMKRRLRKRKEGPGGINRPGPLHVRDRRDTHIGGRQRATVAASSHLDDPEDEPGAPRPGRGPKGSWSVLGRSWSPAYRRTSNWMKVAHRDCRTPRFSRSKDFVKSS